MRADMCSSAMPAGLRDTCVRTYAQRGGYTWVLLCKTTDECLAKGWERRRTLALAAGQKAYRQEKGLA